MYIVSSVNKAIVNYCKQDNSVYTLKQGCQFICLFIYKICRKEAVTISKRTRSPVLDSAHNTKTQAASDCNYFVVHFPN